MCMLVPKNNSSVTNPDAIMKPTFPATWRDTCSFMRRTYSPIFPLPAVSLIVIFEEKQMQKGCSMSYSTRLANFSSRAKYAPRVAIQTKYHCAFTASGITIRDLGSVPYVIMPCVTKGLYRDIFKHIMKLAQLKSRLQGQTGGQGLGRDRGAQVRRDHQEYYGNILWKIGFLLLWYLRESVLIGFRILVLRFLNDLWHGRWIKNSVRKIVLLVVLNLPLTVSNSVLLMHISRVRSLPTRLPPHLSYSAFTVPCGRRVHDKQPRVGSS